MVHRVVLQRWRLTRSSRMPSPAAWSSQTTGVSTNKSRVPIQPAEARRKELGPTDADIAIAAIQENLGVTIDTSEIEHNCQLSDFSIYGQTENVGPRFSAWSRMCNVMYHKPVRTGGSVPSTYVTFDVTKARNHILWCIRRLKKDTASPICMFLY